MEHEQAVRSLTQSDDQSRDTSRYVPAFRIHDFRLRH